jgi:hypothetical protein
MKKGARRRGKELQELASSNTPSRKGNGGLARQLDRDMAEASTVFGPPEILEQSQIVEGSLVEVSSHCRGPFEFVCSRRIAQNVSSSV